MNNLREQEIRKQIDAYIKGQLSEEEIQALWNEFGKNPDLLEDLEIEANIKAVIERNAGLNKKKATVRSLPQWSWYAAAAAVILIVALVQLFRVETPTEMQDFVVGTITPDNIESTDGIRAKDMRITDADSLLNLGFQAAFSGNDDRAMEIFNEVISHYSQEPYGSKAYLNKGILLYNEGDYEQAVLAFTEASERADSSRMIREKAYWYLGNALINIGQLEEARQAVHQAYALDGVFRSAAFRLLQKLNYELGTSDFENFDQQQSN